jgi:hypothetical protein
MTFLLAAILPVLATGAAAPAGTIKLSAPRVEYRANEASATRSPWIDANGWQILRARDKRYYYDVPANGAALAAAEAFAYGANAVVHTDKAGAAGFNRMLDFLRTVPDAELPAMANIGVIDDGSDEAGEMMNLLSRHNLLYKIVTAPDPKLAVNVRLGSKEDPSHFARKIRAQLGDEKRLMRLYGSEVVIARLTGNSSRARLHILNYANRPVSGLRVRVLGSWSKQTVMAFSKPDLKLTDVLVDGTATEFTVPDVGIYVVVDLTRH